MVTWVYIDSCAWNRLHFLGVELAVEVPAARYRLAITREVEIETELFRKSKPESEVLPYIDHALANFQVETSSWFGFAMHDSEGNLSAHQPYGGFDVGTWQSDKERTWLSQAEVLDMLSKSPNKKGPLGTNQADASQGARAFDAVIVTDELKVRQGGKPKGPLQLAWEQGGHVVFLREVEASGMGLDAFIAGGHTFAGVAL
jgi:hypothetical protein